MKRRIIVILLVLTLILASCAPSASDVGSRSNESNASEPQTGVGGYDSRDYESKELSKDDSAAAERKLIWNARMDIEAQDAAALHDNLTAYAAEIGGYEHSNSVDHYESYSAVSVTYKIPPERVQEFMSYAGDAGKVINSSLGSEDITESYYDAGIRLETKRKSLDRYYELLADAKDVEGIVYIQSIIDGITEEIETLEGRLRMWDVLTDMATVSVNIRQQNDPVKIQREISWNTLTLDDMGYLIRSGFVAVTGSLFSVLQWLAVALLVTAPLWIIALVVVFVIKKTGVFKRKPRVRPEMPVTKVVKPEPQTKADDNNTEKGK